MKISLPSTMGAVTSTLLGFIKPMTRTVKRSVWPSSSGCICRVSPGISLMASRLRDFPWGLPGVRPPFDPALPSSRAVPGPAGPGRRALPKQPSFQQRLQLVFAGYDHPPISRRLRSAS